MSNPIIIFGSARLKGNTWKALELLKFSQAFPVVNLKDIQMSHYDYQHSNSDDDYIGIMEKIVKEHDVIILATLVYWYTMSSMMKVFIDRLY